MNKITFYLLNLSTGGASQALPPTSQLSVKHFGQQKSTATAVLEWLPLPHLNQHYRKPFHASSCDSRLFLLVFLPKADRSAKPCSLLPPPAALLRFCHRLRSSVLSISDNKKALPEQCLNGSHLPRLNQRHRGPCHASTCGSRLFLLVFSQKADRCAKPCSLLPPPAALHRRCHRLRPSALSVFQATKKHCLSSA